MAYEVVLEPGEEVAARIELNLSTKAQPFFFAVSNRAIYIPRIKLIAKSDPYYFQRVPIDRVRHIAVTRLRPYGLWLLAGLMISVGLVTTISMMDPVFRREEGRHHVSGWPIALFICGFLVPFAARGRFGLEIWFDGGKYRWKPPLVVDKPSKTRITETFQTIIVACQKVGAPVSANARVEFLIRQRKRRSLFASCPMPALAKFRAEGTESCTPDERNASRKTFSEPLTRISAQRRRTASLRRGTWTDNLAT